MKTKGKLTLDLADEGEQIMAFSSSELHSHWRDMPEFAMGRTEPLRTIAVHFESNRDLDDFGELMDGPPTWDQAVCALRECAPPDEAEKIAARLEKMRPENRPRFSIKQSSSTISKSTNSMWYKNPDTPKKYVAPTETVWASPAGPKIPRYPVYVISKGRWDNPLTAEVLRGMGVPHRVVIEPQERDAYAAALGADRLIVAPENFSKRGDGSIPVRNFVWDHAVAEGHARHWIMDDNIRGFIRLDRNRRLPVLDGAVLCAAEDFTDRYENVGLSGLNYQYMAPQRDEKFPPYFLNTRVYSCILVNHAVDAPWSHPKLGSGDGIRWRGRYNEDTDLSIRVLTAGWSTILINAFLADKVTTGENKGGNEQIYDESWGEGVEVLHDGDRIVLGTETHNGWRRKFAEALHEQHPKIVDIVWRYERWHHEVNYNSFKRNSLRLRADYVPPADPEYGMELLETEKRTNRYPVPPPLHAPAVAPVAPSPRQVKPRAAPLASSQPSLPPQEPVSFGPRRAQPAPVAATPIETFASQNAELLEKLGDAPVKFDEL